MDRAASTFVCPRGHTFDIARSGYVNLLQPQDRRSPDAGDSQRAVESRAALLAAGIGRATLDAVVRTTEPLTQHLPGAVCVELGSGSGDLLGSLARLPGVRAIGIDLSRYAADHAARRFRDVTWVVANADRRLPLLDGSVQVLITVHARRNPAEARRVLREDGLLLAALPAEDDLIELRAAVLGDAARRDRTTAFVAEHAPHFELISRSTARERRTLQQAQVLDLLRSTYRGARLSESTRVQSLPALDVTFASDILVFARARG